MLKVTATSTDGHTSVRRATDKGVVGIIEPGDYWAVETRRERITHAVIAWYFASEEDARRCVHEVNSGTLLHMGDQRNYDARILRARAFEVPADGAPTPRGKKAVTPYRYCSVHNTALPATGRCDDCS